MNRKDYHEFCGVIAAASGLLFIFASALYFSLGMFWWMVVGIMAGLLAMWVYERQVIALARMEA